MSKIVIINGKQYVCNDANKVLENNTNEDLHNHFFGDTIDAKWTRHIQNINKQLAEQVGSYRPGRPAKVKVAEQPEAGFEMGL